MNKDLNEWINWLSYLPDFEKDRIKFLDEKIKNGNNSLLQERSVYTRNDIIADILVKYNDDDCREEQKLIADNFMNNNSLTKLMERKLTLEELNYAKEEIIRICKDKEYMALFKEEEPKTMVDRYVLYMINESNMKDEHNKIKTK